MTAFTTTREDHLIAWLTALAICIHIAESALPSPLPGIKPGLANVVTIAVLLRYGWRMAAWITLLRVLVGSLLLGTFLSPTFILSLSGAVCGILALGVAHALSTRLPGTGLGALGYSMLAALAHMAGQFFVAYALFIPHPALLHLLPVLMTAALLFGLVSGRVAQALLDRVT
ncbi:MAG: Gx transporter family protein [Gammaproteobacteria bacterium]|nr:Gx transporter family protein [Gammaproteobacteria bacterium]